MYKVFVYKSDSNNLQIIKLINYLTYLLLIYYLFFICFPSIVVTPLNYCSHNYFVNYVNSKYRYDIALNCIRY